MILVDSSVWIRFLADKSPYSRGLDDLLALDQVVGHELVYGELLIGDCGGRRELLAAYELLPKAGIIPHNELVAFVLDRSLHGRGVGWIDIHLLASALVSRSYLWTADSRLSAIAIEFGIAYEPANSARTVS